MSLGFPYLQKVTYFLAYLKFSYFIFRNGVNIINLCFVYIIFYILRTKRIKAVHVKQLEKDTIFSILLKAHILWIPMGLSFSHTHIPQYIMVLILFCFVFYLTSGLSQFNHSFLGSIASA